MRSFFYNDIVHAKKTNLAIFPQEIKSIALVIGGLERPAIKTKRSPKTGTHEKNKLTKPYFVKYFVAMSNVILLEEVRRSDNF